MEEVVATQNVLPEPKIVIGFWKRLIAILLDALIVGAVCSIIGIFFRQQLYILGEDGWWIGFLILLCYFGIMQTSIGAGQSIGKKIMKIQVLKMDGSYMSFPQSIGRFLLLAFVLFFSELGTLLPKMYVTATLNLWGIIYSFVIFSLAVGIIFLAGLHPQKRGLHDLLCGTVVVRKGSFNSEQLDILFNKKKLNTAINISLLVFSLIIGIFLIAYILGNVYFKGGNHFVKAILEIKDSIEEAGYMKNVQIKLNKQMGKEPVKTLLISGFVYKDVYDDEAKCKELANKIENIISVKSNDLKELELNRIVLEIRSGYSIWVASVSQKKIEQIDPGDLKTQITGVGH